MSYFTWKCSPTIKLVSGTIPLIAEKIILSFNETVSFSNSPSKKAEGIILKNPNLEYFTGRSENILKVKKFYDDEGLVIGLNYSNNGEFKSLQLKLNNGIIFNLGGGFSDIQRKNPPQIGDIVTFKYYDLTKNNKPKFASFLRIRKKE